MPSVSTKQQKFMGLVLAYKRGEIPGSKVSKNVRQVAASMSEKELEKFAGTKHKGLPRKVENTGIEEGMKLNGISLSKKAEEEVKKYNLANNKAYLSRLDVYVDAYSKRKPSGTAAKNMLRALRMLTWQNTPDDWARLHATEYFMRKRTEEIQPVKEIAGFKIPMDELQKIVQSAVSEVISESVNGEKNEGEEHKFTPDEKKEYMEAIAKFNEYGKHIYRSNKLVETAKKIKKIVEFASKNIMDESGDWFDKVILTRHSKKMNESLKIFEKTAEEMSKLQQRMEAVYEEIGETLGKYYDIK